MTRLTGEANCGVETNGDAGGVFRKSMEGSITGGGESSKPSILRLVSRSGTFKSVISEKRLPSSVVDIGAYDGAGATPDVLGAVVAEVEVPVTKADILGMEAEVLGTLAELMGTTIATAGSNFTGGTPGSLNEGKYADFPVTKAYPPSICN